ncbi:amidohydrolase [Gracilibacillus oryzae]|uniref:Amidohydrolase n=1 Tax=Gracilibacillus oryzae TaxID=1672701 RepID=A0A7C8L0P5_9BACI|nr:amidohydrolase [Gracilibacillus oryzae]KAB8138268.1 amidohydrolase [Gracilibacillus oryzae]
MGTLWYGGKIYTMKQVDDLVEAVYTEKGKIIATGSLAELKTNYRDKIKQINDLKENIMYPGFVDSHLHIIGHGEKLLRVDLSMMESAEQVLDAIAKKVKELNKDEWLIADGWNENQWQDKRIIDKRELDQLTSDNPVMLTRICRHAVIVNSKALELANITAASKDPQGGRIIRYENGEPTGYLLDQAQELVKNIVPAVSQEKLEKTTETAIKDLLSKGLVGGHTEDLAYYSGFSSTLEAFRSILPHKFKFRAHLLVHHNVFHDMISAGYRYGDGGDYTTLGAMKVFSDGALGGRTAWLSEPYEDDPENAGIPIHSEVMLERLIQQAREFNHPIAVHAIGDMAVWQVANLLKKYPLTNHYRDRIIHAQIVNKEVIELLKEIDVVLDIQPTFVTSDFPWVIERIGEKRAEQSYPWKTFLNENIACAAGSDAPIEEVSPLNGIKAFVTRKSSIDGNTYGESEQLSVYEAISLYTKGSAYVINHEHDRGIIEKDYVADFTILTEDLFSIEPDRIDQVEVAGTVVAGEWMYKKIEKNRVR